ncbi:hypothetical protein ARMGADRAFT_1088606 [Armillaria gallica]|uniref:DUF6534 domain-containing protein n=1 Tax=Armillaria gallica TaxID=47427 RepID=A0A2H3CM29_ARMGA|nr:hypothetical protein ARMGADRAFT_1088606 [Armillaria gallica]
MASHLPRSTASPGNTLGALYVGTTIAAILFGITNLQMLIYYKRYPDDLRIYRYSVAILWVLDAFHVALSTHMLYFYMVDMYGDLVGALGYPVWSFRLQLVINVLIVLYVQGLYAIRIWNVLGHHFGKILPWLVLLAIAISLGAGIFLVYDIYVTATLPSFFARVGVPIYFYCSAVVVADLTIALMMCYYLYKSRTAMNFSTTLTPMLLHMMRLILVSGLATSACSLLTLIAFIMWPESLIFMGIDFILPKLYINSLLAMFNHRHKHRSNKSSEEHGGRSLSAVLQFVPHNSEHSTAETNIRIPLQDMCTLKDTRKGTLGPSQA